jgi:hypothetical protein
MTEWVTCPICGGEDMPAEKDVGTDGETVFLVRCSNLACKSNVKAPPDRPSKLYSKIYFHRSKEENWGLQEELRLSDEIMEKFRYMGSEISLDVEIDTKTGETFATHFEGHELPTKVSLT